MIKIQMIKTMKLDESKLSEEQLRNRREYHEGLAKLACQLAVVLKVNEAAMKHICCGMSDALVAATQISNSQGPKEATAHAIAGSAAVAAGALEALGLPNTEAAAGVDILLTSVNEYMNGQYAREFGGKRPSAQLFALPTPTTH